MNTIQYDMQNTVPFETVNMPQLESDDTNESEAAKIPPAQNKAAQNEMNPSNPPPLNYDASPLNYDPPRNYFLSANDNI